MATTERIAALLKDVATSMRALLKDTATGGNSEDLRTIAGWIAEVEELTVRVNPNGLVPSIQNRPAATEPSASEVPRPPRKTIAKREARFEREGESLVKIAWSKKNRAEYEHKAPRTALASVVERVERAGRARKMFRMEEVLPVIGEDGAEIPSYQSYLCVGWLKSEGLLEQHGRQGYTIPPNVSISKDMDRAWTNLSAKGL